MRQPISRPLPDVRERVLLDFLVHAETGSTIELKHDAPVQQRNVLGQVVLTVHWQESHTSAFLTLGDAWELYSKLGQFLIRVEQLEAERLDGEPMDYSAEKMGLTSSPKST